MDSENYLLKVYRYIELNPVRAGMVEHASDYSWSSYQGNAVGRDIALLTPHECYLKLGSTEQERQAQYRLLFRGQMAERDLTDIREATNRGWVLGEDRFKQQIEKATGRRANPLGRGGDRKSERFRESANQ